MNKLVRRILGIIPVLAMALAKLSVTGIANIFPYQPDIPDELKESNIEKRMLCDFSNNDKNR